MNDMGKLSELGNGVYRISGPVIDLAADAVTHLRKAAAETPRARARICAHPGDESKIHEMLIVLSGNTYVRPHKHLTKIESYHIVEGETSLVLFSDSGEIEKVIEMGDYASGKAFYFRLSGPVFHTLVIHSPDLVLFETTDGPFVKSECVFAPWAPEETDTAEIPAYREELKRKLSSR